MVIPLISECIGDGTSSFSVDWISHRLACYVRLKEGLEFLNINASFLTLLKDRHIPKPTVNIRPVMKLASLLLTIAAYRRKESRHTIEFLTWFMASCNLDHLKRITLNFPRYGVASAPMDGLLLKDVIGIINLITEALPEEKRRLGTAIILDCRSWSTPLEDEYHASLAENPEEQPFTIRLSGLHKDYFLYLLHDYAVKRPRTYFIRHIFFPLHIFPTLVLPIDRVNLQNDVALGVVYKWITHKWVLYHYLKTFSLVIPDAMMFSKDGTFLNNHPFLSQLHNVCPDFAEYKVCNIAPGLHRPVITAPSEDLYETALARLLRDDTTGMTGEQMLAKAAKLGYRLEDPEKFAEFLRPGSLSCYGASQGDTIRIPLVSE